MEIINININEEKPIFIVGSKRGGTTLLRRIINAHLSITIPPPGWFYHFIYSQLYSYGDLKQKENILILIKDCLEIPPVKKYWCIKKNPEEILDILPEKSFRGVLVALFWLYSHKYNTTIWGSKTPSNSFWLKEIQRDFPKARFVMIFRDGRDVSIDLCKVIWGPNNLYTACLLWQSYIQAILHSKKFLNPNSFYEIYYEDLVKNPETELKKLCSFLDLDFEQGMLKYYEVEPDSFVGKEDYHRETSQPITDKYIGIHKKLPLIDRQLQVSLIDKTMERLGYKVEDNPREIGFWERERYLELDRHGGFILKGALEYKHRAKKKQLERKGNGVWNYQSKKNFILNIDSE